MNEILDKLGRPLYLHSDVVCCMPTYSTLVVSEVVKVNNKSVRVQFINDRGEIQITSRTGDQIVRI